VVFLSWLLGRLVRRSTPWWGRRSRWAGLGGSSCEAFGLVAEEEAVDEAFDEFSVLVGEALGGF
jgi:hypothetical protein